MSFVGNTLQSVRTSFFADLSGMSFAPGTNILVQTLNEQPSGTPNQQWRIESLSTGKNLFTIQSVLTGQYVGVNGFVGAGVAIVSTVDAMPWQINSLGPSNAQSHSITIQVPFTDLFWNVNADARLTKILLAKGDGSKGQQWTPRTTLSA